MTPAVIAWKSVAAMQSEPMPNQSPEPSHVATVAPKKTCARDWLPWVALGCGLFTWPLLILGEELLKVKATQSQPVYEIPILMCGFCICCFSAFFTRIRLWLKFVVSILGALGFILVYFFTAILLMAIFGVPGC